MKPKRIDENHSFNIHVAAAIGIEKAILMKELYGWCLKNGQNQRNLHGGLPWTYNSARAFAEKFPYMSPRSISRWLSELESELWISSHDGFNKAGFDRTKHYTVNFAKYDYTVMGETQPDTEQADWLKSVISAISQNGQPISQNGEWISQNGQPISQNGQTIPSLNNSYTTRTQEREAAPEIATPANGQIKANPSPAAGRFQKPTADEITGYLEDLYIEPQWQPRFRALPCTTAEEMHDYYEANGWKVGRNPMKDWRAACRNWLKNNEKFNRSNTNSNAKPTKQPLFSEAQHRSLHAEIVAELREQGRL